jgi:hypothetical protein
LPPATQRPVSSALATQAPPSSSTASAVRACVPFASPSPTTSYSPLPTSHRRSPGAPAAHRYGAFAASAVIGPVSARATTTNSAAVGVGVAGPPPTPA